jgi:Ser/Thr protein kinase RdoA (MazF antagonist)
MPAPLTAIGEVVVEETVPGVSALALAPPQDSPESAMRALAELHSLDLHEGLGWDRSPAEILPAEPLPLHRLGFASQEREAAAGPLLAAREALLNSPWGFSHGDATAGNVLLAPGRAWLVAFHAAGFRPQFFDVAAFLLTSGLQASRREELAGLYGERRGLDPQETRDLVDLAGIAWGIAELLVLPRRSIELLGDDASLSALNTAAARTERAMREPAGYHPAAAAIRAALWPR